MPVAASSLKMLSELPIDGRDRQPTLAMYTSLPSADTAAVAVTPPPTPGTQAGQSASVAHDFERSSQHWPVVAGDGATQVPGSRKV